MSEHRLRVIKWKCTIVVLYCAACAWAIAHGWSNGSAIAHGWPL